MADPKLEIFQSCGLAFKTPLIPKEYQSNSDIEAKIFLRKPYPCGRQDESNKLDFVFEAPKLVDNQVQKTAPVSPIPPIEPIDDPIYVGNPTPHFDDGFVFPSEIFAKTSIDHVGVQPQVTAAPKKLVALQNVDQAMTTKYIIDHAESNVENAIEKFLSKNSDETLTDPNSQIAKIFAQTSNRSLVGFLSNQQLEEEIASKTNEANTGQLKSKKCLPFDNFRTTKTLHFVISKFWTQSILSFYV